MSTTNRGDEPAYPVEQDSLHYGQPCTVRHPGMTIREAFAMAAPAAEIHEMLPSTVGDCAKMLGIRTQEYNRGQYIRLVAKMRAAWADALIAELAKEGRE